MEHPISDTLLKFDDGVISAAEAMCILCQYITAVDAVAIVKRIYIPTNDRALVYIRAMFRIEDWNFPNE